MELLLIQTCHFLLYKMLIDCPESCVLLVDYCYDFIIMFYILTAPIHCRGSIGEQWCNAKFLQICSNELTNSSTSWMAWGRVNFQQIFISNWTIKGVIRCKIHFTSCLNIVCTHIHPIMIKIHPVFFFKSLF